MLSGFQTRTKIVYRAATPETRRRNEVALHIARGWCPVNPVIKNKALNLLEHVYVDRDLLLEVVMQDPGLFTFIMRNLCNVLPDKDQIDPINELRNLELHKLKALLLTPERQQSRHKFNNATIKQYTETCHCVSAITAARSLSRQLSMDADQVAWRTYLTEILYLLVAWNYPVQFSLAVARQKSNATTLTTELELLLGIKLESMLEQYLKQWRVRITAASNEAEIADQQTSVSKFAALWSRINTSDHFSQYRQELASLSENFAKILPADWQESLQSECAAVITNFSKFEPARFKLDKDKEEQQTTNLCSRTLAKLNGKQQNILNPVVKELQNKNPQSALLYLVNIGIPALGFTEGCLAAKYSEESQLTPLVRFGSTPLRHYNDFFLTVDSQMDELLNTNIPFSNATVGINGQQVESIVAGINNVADSALLYLEYDEQSPLHNEQANLIFRCVRDLLEVTLQQLQSLSNSAA